MTYKRNSLIPQGDGKFFTLPFDVESHNDIYSYVRPFPEYFILYRFDHRLFISIPIAKFKYK